jgi:UDP-2,3-diacylglucosamine hydrolase
MPTPSPTIPRLGIIAGNGVYPATMLRAARAHGVAYVAVAAFLEETQPELEKEADAWDWFRVGHLGKMIKFFKAHQITQVVMVGQIAPKNLWTLRPDIRTMLMLAKLPRKNAETIFGGIGNELAKDGITLLSAVTFLEEHMPGAGHVAGPVLKEKYLRDAPYGLQIAKEVSRLDIGQTVVVKKGTVLAVEGFEGTNECILRGGPLGRGEATVAKVSKPNQDMRFDVPVVGPHTIETCAKAGVRVLVVEAGMTLLLERERVEQLCQAHGVSVVALQA